MTKAEQPQSAEMTPPQHSVIADPQANEFLTFTLGQQEYGVDILKVQEIRSHEAVATIANAP